MANLTSKELAEMMAKLDDVCEPSREVSERTKRILAARGSSGLYQSGTRDHHTRIRHRSSEKPLVRFGRLCAHTIQRGLIHGRALLTAFRWSLSRNR